MVHNIKIFPNKVKKLIGNAFGVHLATMDHLRNLSFTLFLWLCISLSYTGIALIYPDTYWLDYKLYLLLIRCSMDIVLFYVYLHLYRIKHGWLGLSKSTLSVTIVPVFRQSMTSKSGPQNIRFSKQLVDFVKAEEGNKTDREAAWSMQSSSADESHEVREARVSAMLKAKNVMRQARITQKLQQDFLLRSHNKIRVPKPSVQGFTIPEAEIVVSRESSLNNKTKTNRRNTNYSTRRTQPIIQNQVWDGHNMNKQAMYDAVMRAQVRSSATRPFSKSTKVISNKIRSSSSNDGFRNVAQSVMLTQARKTNASINIL